jgi:hypothetical protein
LESTSPLPIPSSLSGVENPPLPSPPTVPSVPICAIRADTGGNNPHGRVEGVREEGILHHGNVVRVLIIRKALLRDAAVFQCWCFAYGRGNEKRVGWRRRGMVDVSKGDY